MIIRFIYVLLVIRWLDLRILYYAYGSLVRQSDLKTIHKHQYLDIDIFYDVYGSIIRDTDH